MITLIISLLILTSYIALYLSNVGLLPSHSNSWYALREKNKNLGFLFPVTLATSSFLLLITALEYTPDPFKFTAFLTCAPVIFTAFAPRYKGNDIESSVHFTGAKIGGIMSFLWAMWMSVSVCWWFILIVAILGLIFYLLNRKYHKPMLFLEYWVFSYPYAILLLTILIKSK